MILLLPFLSPRQTYSLCVPEDVCRPPVSASIPFSLTLVDLLSVKSLTVLYLMNESSIN